MYCSACGAKVAAGVKHCKECGRLIAAHQHDSKKRLAILKPKLIIWLVIVRYLIIQINMTFVGGAVGGGIIFLHQLYLGRVDISWEPFLYSGLFFFITIPIIAIFISKRTYDLTRYVFFEDRLEYYEGFWNVERKIINYHSITEVALKKSIIQRIYHMGSIHVLIPSLSNRQPGIVIADIKNPEKAFHFLQKVIRGEHYE